MEIQTIIDNKCGYKFNEVAEKLTEYWKKNGIKANKKSIVVIFSNDWNFVKNISLKQAKAFIINVTENLSEQHVINTLKFVSDICYLKTDVNLITTRIVKAYNRANLMQKRSVGL